MNVHSLARGAVAHEARSLLSRLVHLEPFSVLVPMVAGAAPCPRVLLAIEGHLLRGRRELKRRMESFLGWLAGPEAACATPEELQRRYVEVRLRFNAILAEVDIFADALGQRAESRTGVWLSGLDRLAEDSLALPPYFEPPPVLCYLDRGLGAAIRRARTRLPSGSRNPVAIIQVPRERMVGAGIASSIAHEVGHQASALLDLVPSVRAAMQARAPRSPTARAAWTLWERWSSEVISDLWGISRIGVGAVTGLLAVVSLPRFFVFRVSPNDPHPPPWMRVRIACAIGDALYPNPQWRRLRELWEALYPVRVRELPAALYAALEDGIAPLVALLLEHRPHRLQGKTLADALHLPDREPARLMAAWGAWRADGSLAPKASPSLAFAIIGQARAAGAVTAHEEAHLLATLLTRWGVEGAVGRSQRLVA